MNTIKKELLKKIEKHYLGSSDFNGIKANRLGIDKKRYIIELFQEGKIDVISPNFTVNPFIKLLNFNVPKSIIIDEIENNFNKVVIYPSEKHLKNINTNVEEVFTEQLAKGKPQLEIIYFSVEILEEYFNNPKYDINFNGYKGNIYLKDIYVKDESNFEYIKDFGMAFQIKDKNKRAIGIILRDLSRLSKNDQLKWNIKKLPNQKDYKIETDFLQNMLGYWSENYWIYECLLEEIKIINKMCKEMKLEPLFRKEYNINDDQMKSFRTILLPTEKNYNSFHMILEKLLVNNLNEKTFFKKTNNSVCVNSTKNKDGTNKGSLLLFSEWLNLNITNNNNLENDIIKPLKTIRKKRQKPAHTFIIDNYNEDIWRLQKEDIVEAYKTVRAIRLLFSNHPATSVVEIPEYLFLGKNIVTY